jgi:hypothetical protein
MLGKCYLAGWGVTKDHATARQWLAKAIENPNTPDAYVSFAKDYYKKCNNGVIYGDTDDSNNNFNYGKLAQDAYSDGNYDDAFRYGQLGANKNDAEAMTVLGNCYSFGNGVSKDYRIAVIYYQKAAEQNNWRAQFNLGLCYQNGWGVTENHATARQWYAKVIENPNSKDLFINLSKDSYKKCNNGVPYRGK